MLTRADEEAGALIAKPRPEIIRPDAPAAQWELAAAGHSLRYECPPENVDALREEVSSVNLALDAVCAPTHDGPGRARRAREV